MIAKPPERLPENAPPARGVAEAVAGRRGARVERILRVAAPVAIGILALALWEGVVPINEVPHYILPGPILVFQSLIQDWGTLFPSLLITLQITFMALAVATAGGVGLAICSRPRDGSSSACFRSP